MSRISPIRTAPSEIGGGLSSDCAAGPLRRAGEDRRGDCGKQQEMPAALA